jgi:hypothetical protein
MYHNYVKSKKIAEKEDRVYTSKKKTAFNWGREVENKNTHYW